MNAAVVVLLGVVAGSTPSRPQLAATGFSAVGVPPSLAVSFAETLSLRLSQTKLVQVRSASDVAALLGAERQRQLLGCSTDDSSCLAELAGALGAEGLIRGEVAKVGSVIQLTVKVLRGSDGSVLFETLERFKSEEEVLGAIDRIARVAATTVHSALAPGAGLAEVATQSSAPARSPVPLAVMGVGVAAAVGGAVAWGLAGADYAALVGASPELADASAANARASAGATKQTVGLSLIGGGAAVALGGLLWYLLQPVSDANVALAISPGGVFVGLRGSY